MNVLVLLMLIHSSIQSTMIAPPITKTEIKTEDHTVSYKINLENKGDKAFMRISIIPEQIDNYVKVFVSNGEDEPGMRNSQYKCLERQCIMWIPQLFYYKANILSMQIECKTYCHYYYSISYFYTMTIEDNSYFYSEIVNKSNFEIVYPISQQTNKFMLFITSVGYGDIEVLLSDNEQTSFQMEPIVFNGFGIVLEDKAPIDGKKYIMKVTVLHPTVITVGHNNLSPEKTLSIFLNKPEYSILNYKLDYISECYSVSIPESEAKENSFLLNARSATNNAHLYIQNSQTQEVILSKDIFDTDFLIFSLEQITNNKLCLKRVANNNNDYVSVQFQLLNLSSLLTNQAWVTHLDRGVLTKGYLPNKTILYYRLLKYIKPSNAQVKTYLRIQLQVIKGTPLLYHYHCEEYPYCQVKPEDIQVITHQLSLAKKVNDNYYYSINVNDLNPYHSVIQDAALVYCLSDTECVYNIIMQNANEDNTMLFDNKPISIYISPLQTSNYSFEINNPEVTSLKIEFNSFNGKADFTVTKAIPSNNIGEYMYSGSKEVYILSSEEGGSIKGTYIISVKGITNAFYKIHYTTKTKDSMFKQISLDSGEMMLSTINKKEKSKSISYTNLIRNSESFITIETINCNTSIKYKEQVYTDRISQIIIQSNEIEQHELNIDLLSLDTQSSSENEKCFVYSIGKESSNNQRLLLNEGIKHSMRLSGNTTRVNYVYPFYFGTNNVDIENILIIINKKSEGKLFFSYTLNQKSSAITELIMIQYKSIVIPKSNIQKQCQVNNICSLLVLVRSSSGIYPIDYDIRIFNNHQIPTYLDKNIIVTNTLFGDKKYQYYYSDIGYNQQGEIKVHFIQGQGQIISKIVGKETQEENPDWNKRIKLPAKEDSNLLQYDFDENKIVYTIEDTKDCQKAGCEIYIGLYSDSETAINSTEYILSLKDYSSIVNLDTNTYTYGSLSKQKGEFFTVYIPIDNNKATIEFIHHFGVCYIKLGREKPSENDYDWVMNGRNQFLEILSSDAKIGKESLKGLFFTFGLFSSIISKYDLSYKFRVTLNQKGIINIVDGKGGENLSCQTDEDRCYFSIPINGYDNVKDFSLYAFIEDALSNTLTIFSAFFDGDKYDKMSADELKQKLPNENQSDYSSKTQFNTNYLLIHFTPQGEAINGYLLITIVSKQKGRLILMSSFNKAASLSNLKSEDYQLFYLDEDSEMKLNVIGERTYSVNIKRVEGIGTVSNNINIKERAYIMGEKSVEVTMIFKPTMELPVQISFATNQKNYFLFIIQYTIRPEINIDAVPYGSAIFIEYQRKTPFPLSYYLPIDDEESDVSLNFSYEAFEFGHELDSKNQQFDIRAFITNEDIVVQLKNNPSPIQIGFELSTNYDYCLKMGVFTASSQQIKTYSSAIKKYIYFIISPSKDNKNKYDYFTSKIYAYQTKSESVPIELKSNRFYFSKLINQSPQFIKLMKRKTNDSLMEVNVAFSTRQISFSLNHLIDNPSSIDYKQNSTGLIASEKEMNGFARITIDLQKVKTGLLISFFKLSLINKDEAEAEGNFALEYITYSNQISHLSLLKAPNYNITKKAFIVSFDTVVNDKQEPALADYALKLYKKTKDNEELKKTNTFYSHFLPEAIYSLNRVLTPNVTFQGQFPTEDEYYLSIVTRAIIRRNDEFIEEYFAFPIYLWEKEENKVKPLNIWAYIGGGIGGVVLILGIIVLVWYISMKKKQKKRITEAEYQNITNAVDNIGL